MSEKTTQTRGLSENELRAEMKESVKRFNEKFGHKNLRDWAKGRIAGRRRTGETERKRTG